MPGLHVTTEQRYSTLLQQVIFAPNLNAREEFLAEAFELGRGALSQDAIPPDELVAIHHNAILCFSQKNPDMKLCDVVDLLTLPLIEMSMAYGMSFREQLEKQYRALLDKRLQESHRLEAVGTLAAGIAHEFNNLLCSIIGFSELAFEGLSDEEPAKESIQQVLVASLRARDLVSTMLQLARKNSGLPSEEIDLISEINSVIKLVDVREKKLEINFSSGVPNAFITAKPGQIQQIILNLCINAADAMEHCGTIDINIESTTSDECLTGVGESAICITISDQGTGIPPEVQEQIFNPFFTTKEPGKGTGLGLSVVHRMVEDLGGRILVESRTTGGNNGTDFRIILPFVDKDKRGTSCQKKCSLYKAHNHGG